MTHLRHLLLLLALPVGAQENISVTGVVRQSLTGNPLANILITFNRTDAPAPERSLTSPADGRFAFHVPPGAYRLMAESPTYGGQIYGATYFQSGLGVSLLLSPGTRLEPLDFRLIPPALIEGAVTDSFGEPVEHAILQLLQKRIVDGRQHVTARASAYTDDLGQYRFSGLAPGEYYLMTSATPWHSTYATPAPGEAYYYPQFYPNARTPDSASPIILSAGQTVQADFQLEVGEGSDIELTLVPPPSNGSTLRLLLMAPGILGRQRLQQTTYVYAPEHILSGNPPGDYEVTLMGTANGKMVRGATRFTLGSSNLKVTVPLTPSPTVSGRLDCSNPSSSRPTLTLYDPDQSARVPAALRPDGTFTTPPITPGRYSVLLAGSSNCYLHRLTLAGQPLPENRLSVGADPITGLLVETKADAGSLHGVLRRGDLPQPGVKVYLAPVPPNEAGPYRAYLTDSDGSFDFLRLPPGRYALFLAPGVPELFEYANPESIFPYLKNAPTIDLEANQRIRHDIAQPDPQ